MRFAKDLRENIIEAWAPEYIDYVRMKELLKTLTPESEDGRPEFWAEVDLELDKVNRFYLRKVDEYEGRIQRIMSGEREEERKQQTGGGDKKGQGEGGAVPAGATDAGLEAENAAAAAPADTPPQPVPRAGRAASECDPYKAAISGSLHQR